MSSNTISLIRSGLGSAENVELGLTTIPAHNDFVNGLLRLTDESDDETMLALLDLIIEQERIEEPAPEADAPPEEPAPEADAPPEEPAPEADAPPEEPASEEIEDATLN